MDKQLKLEVVFWRARRVLYGVMRRAYENRRIYYDRDS